MRYLLYARKSSESEDKQAQSIDDQLTELRRLSQEQNLHVVAELTEARSAKAPGGRPVFAELIERINRGEADAILCWHVNRLFRNPVDFGAVSWMLQTGALQEIRTPHQVHRFGDNVLLLSVENGMANQYIIDLRKNVERGLRSKVEKGWFPHRAPEGYRNVDGIILPDSDRFPMIREAFDKILSGRFSVPQVHEWLCSTGYVTKAGKRTGGTPLTRTTLYNIFGNIFYAGMFVRGGETHQGAHEQMVTLAEFFRVQKLIKTRNTRQRTHEWAFGSLIVCGECGCQVVGERKMKALASGIMREYRYYSCSNAKRTCRRTVIREEAIKAQISALLETLRVPIDLIAAAEESVIRWKAEAVEFMRIESHVTSRAITELESRQSGLLDMKLRSLLTDEEFLKEKKRTGEELTDLRIGRRVDEETSGELYQNVLNSATLLHYGTDLFASGPAGTQNLIAKAVGAKYVLTAGRLAVELAPVFSAVCELKKSHETGSDNLETPGQRVDSQVWWNLLDAMRSAIEASKASIPNVLSAWGTGFAPSAQRREHPPPARQYPETTTPYP